MITKPLRSICLFLLASFALALNTQSVKAETINCTAITSGSTVIAVQGVYCLTGDIATNMATGNAIEIQTNNVTIDMNGFKLGNLAAGPGTSANGIYAWQRKNITIRNGSIRGFYNGIYLQDSFPYAASSGHLVEDIRADGNTYRGIVTQGTGNLIRNNQIVNTGGSTVQAGAFGIVMVGGGDNIVRGNTVNTTTGTTGPTYGVYLSTSSASLVKDNLVTNTTSSSTTYGISLSNGSQVSVRENDVTTADNGIYFAGGSTGKYMDNLTNNVTTPFTGGTAVGTNN